MFCTPADRFLYVFIDKSGKCRRNPARLSQAGLTERKPKKSLIFRDGSGILNMKSGLAADAKHIIE
jgi:hypothetical protein